MQQPIKFLVVCSDPGESRDLRGMLETSGHRVLTVTDAEGALALLRTERDIDWVITGIKLGGATDGFRFVEAIRADDNLARIPIFVIFEPPTEATRAKHEADVMLGASLGMTDFLLQPIRWDALWTKVIIARQRREQAQSN